MRKARKSLAILLAVAMVFCMAPAMVFGAGDDGQVNRIAGNDRYITSAETALRAFESADTVLIARGDDEGGFADGLAASYLAGVENAPILLTEPNGLPPVVKDAISKLGAKKAIILGGPAVVSDKVKDDLAGLEVERIFGDDRFETAAKIAAKGKADTAFVVSGYAPADSLVAGPLAFSKNYPILLVGNNVPDFTSKALADLGIKNIYVIGGTGVVSESVYNDLAAKADQIVRYGGNDRVATSLEVAQNLYTNPVNFSIVGYDGLADAVGAAVFGNPILYTDSDLGISGIQSYLAGAVTADSNVNIFGGTGVVSNAAETALENIVPDELKVEIVSAINATTIEVVFEGVEEPVTFELEEELVDGENTVTFEYEGIEYTVTVNYEAPAPVVDKSALEEAIADAAVYEEEAYTAETWEVFAEALANAEEVVANEEATQEEVDEALEALEAAIAGLEKAPVALSVESVSAINANQISVTFDNGETVIVDLEVALVEGENEVTFEYEGVEYTETVTYEAPDTEAPVLVYDGETTFEVEFGAEFTLPEVTATDNVDEAVEVTSVITLNGETVEAIDTTVAGTYTITYSAVDAAGNAAESLVITVNVAEEALKVESVSAINGTEVEVEITALEEDLLGATIEVIDNEGNVVEVKPTDIAAGDTVVFFEFVETQTELEGVWTVAGIEFDLDLATKLEAFVDADTQLKLNAALQDLEIENVLAANLPDYLAAKDDFLAELEDEVTKEDIQTFINDVNTEVEESGTEAEQKEAALEAVVDALEANNDVLLLQALQNDLFVRVNDEWLGDKANGYKGEFYADDTNLDDLSALTFDQIQGKINTVNDAEIGDVIDALVSTGNPFLTSPSDIIDSVDVGDLQEAKVLIESYATLDDEGEYDDANMETALDQIDLQLAVANVLAATTPNTLQARLTALDVLDDEMDDALDMDEYIHDNARAYLDGLESGDFVTYPEAEDGLSGLANNVTVTDIQNVIDDVNDAISGSYLTVAINAATAIETEIAGGTVDDVTDAQKDDLIDALEILGVKQVAEGNVDYYVDEIDSLTNDVATDLTDKDDFQALVDAGNVEAVQDADKNTIIAKLNVFGIDNIVDENAEAYVADANIAGITADATGDNDATVTAVETAVDAANKAVVVAAQVEAINDADDVATVKVALDTLADVDEVADYLKIRSVDREFVAAYVLENRPATPGYANLGAIDTEVTAAETAYSTALGNINGIVITDSIDTVVSALEDTLDEGYNALSNTAKVEAAEAFFDQLVFDDFGAIKTPFTTLAAVKALL
jgi:putative cell wall-binding protein